MTPTPQGIASAIAKTLKTRAVIADVYGPFAGGDGATIYRTKTVNGAMFQITVRELERPA